MQAYTRHEKVVRIKTSPRINPGIGNRKGACARYYDYDVGVLGVAGVGGTSSSHDDGISAMGNIQVADNTTPEPLSKPLIAVHDHAINPAASTNISCIGRSKLETVRTKVSQYGNETFQ
jgi:hypothetical protein